VKISSERWDGIVKEFGESLERNQEGDNNTPGKELACTTPANEDLINNKAKKPTMWEV
jgi:hypothetical protein